MNPLTELERMLASSDDPGNPTAAELRDLFESVRRIAVVGLSRDPLKAARRVPSYLATKGYELIPVNPNATRILGRRAYDTLGEVPDGVDMVLIFRPSEVAGSFVEAAASRADRPAIWLQSGVRADEEIATARASGITAVQDLCAFRVHRALFS
jgi:predicted CoA-binding protein